jgi:hypothetical protein
MSKLILKFKGVVLKEIFLSKGRGRNGHTAW